MGEFILQSRLGVDSEAICPEAGDEKLVNFSTTSAESLGPTRSLYRKLEKNRFQ
jgi:hypothetical protein